jgi:iron complex transport system permease protein
LLIALAFMFVGLRGNLALALELRAVRLLALVQVGVAIAVSTVVFQTVTANWILTPSIMGLDALYLSCPTALVFEFGELVFASLDPRLKFFGEVGLMTTLLALLLPMLRRRFNIGLHLLTGIVLPVLFRSLSTLLARLIDPNEFAVVQAASLADFNAVRSDLLAVGLAFTSIGLAIAWRARHVLDILALGADSAVGLGG